LDPARYRSIAWPSGPSGRPASGSARLDRSSGTDPSARIGTLEWFRGLVERAKQLRRFGPSLLNL
jgi:hypothetical protein